MQTTGQQQKKHPEVIKSDRPEILLVEDNDDDAEIVMSVFEKNHHSIYRLRNGEDALDYLLQKGKFLEQDKSITPRIVLLDINLPKLSGIDVLKRLRANPRTEKIPVFMFTSSLSDYNASESYRLGIISYIRKQASFEKFEEALLETDIYLKEHKVLIVEDNPADAEIVFNELNNSNLKCTYKLVVNKEEYKKALVDFKPDIIFCDYELSSNFDAIQAVRVLKETNVKIPFILFTGQLNENFAAACLTEGMDDYLLKGQFKRFPIVLVNNLRKKKIEDDKARAIANLQKSEKELKTLFESIDEVFFSMDMVHGQLIQISPACQLIYGYSKQNFFDDPGLLKKCLHPDDAHVLASAIEKLSKGETIIYESRIIRADNEIRLLQLKVKPTLNENEKLIRVDGVAVDITERKEAEEKRRKYLILESKNKEMEQFVYVASHDLREPLLTIKNYIELLIEDYGDNLDKGAEKYTTSISKAAMRMDELISGLLDYSRLSKVKQIQDVDCNEIAKEVQADLNLLITSTGAIIVIDELPKLRAYPLELKLIFQNLINNAIKFRKKHVTPEIHISSQKVDKGWRFEIKDNGIGIEEKNTNKIFVIFQRLHNRNEYPGTGIGLAHCKRIAESHNGTIWVESKPGDSSSFYFTILTENV